MGAVPLDGFPADFRPRCPKCKSQALEFTVTRHPYVWGKGDITCSCYACGLKKYGEMAVRQAFNDQLQNWQVEYDAEKALRDKEREEKKAAHRFYLAAKQRERTAQLQVKEQEARAERQRNLEWLEQIRREAMKPKETVVFQPTPTPEKKCNWATCENPAKPNSMYCSRVCSNKNAHARAAERRKSLATKSVSELDQQPEIKKVDKKKRNAILKRKAHYEGLTGTTTISE